MEIVSQSSLQSYNTLSLPGTAEYFCTVQTMHELREGFAFARRKKLVVSVLGGGSNTVVMNQVAGLVIRVANRGVEVLEENDDSVLISIAAGENWHQLVMDSLANGWFGLENLALIPGCVGAAPIQNIGAYGVELSSFLVCVNVVDITSGIERTMTADECELGYRNSIFKQDLKGQVVIWSVHLKLSKRPDVNLGYPELARALVDVAPDPASVAKAVIGLRQRKLPDPDRIANAGSFFKNPVLSEDRSQQLLESCPDIPHYPQPNGTTKFPAAWLIDRAGWKGVTQGHVGVHPGQALVLIHYGGGEGDELLLFSNKIKKSIKDKYHIDLEMEPVVLGKGI